MFRRPTSQFFEVTVEAFNLCKKAHVESVTIKDPDGIVRISGGDQPIASRPNRLEMPRRDETGYTGDCEVLHLFPQ